MGRLGILGPIALVASVSAANGQPVDCQRILNELLRSGPGVYSPGQAQDMAAVYNRHCLPGQQQSQPQYQQQPQHQPAPRYENLAAINSQRATGPAFNTKTNKWEKRSGWTVTAPNGKKIWYHPPIYSGSSYVYLHNVGYVEVEEQFTQFIFPALHSGVPDKVLEAVLLIEGYAIMQGMIERQGPHWSE
jgi:hypothetical protein